LLTKNSAKNLGLSLNIDAQCAELPEDLALAWLPIFLDPVPTLLLTYVPPH